MKTVLTLLILTTFCCFVCGCYAQSGFTPVKPTIQGTNITIKTADELAWVAEVTNYGNRAYSDGIQYGTAGGFENYTISLEDNIDMGNKPWKPIGNYYTLGQNYPFRGTFLGNGHSISNLNLELLTYHSIGLFGYITGKVDNLQLASGIVKGNDEVGGICGVNRGTITNCTSNCRISGKENTGGVCGWNNYGYLIYHIII